MASVFVWLEQTLINSSAVFSGSFVPTIQFEKLEIHKVFLRFPNFYLEQNLSLTTLVSLISVYLRGNGAYCFDALLGGAALRRCGFFDLLRSLRITQQSFRFLCHSEPQAKNPFSL